MSGRDALRLFEIDQALEALLDGCEVDEGTGELLLTDATRELMGLPPDADLEAAIQSLELEQKQIALDIGAVILGEETEAQAVAATIKALQARKSRHMAKAGRLREILTPVLARLCPVDPEKEAAGKSQKRALADGRVRCRFQRSPGKLVIDDAGDLPDEEWVWEPQPPRRRDEEIKRRVKAGEEVSGARVEKPWLLKVEAG